MAPGDSFRNLDTVMIRLNGDHIDLLMFARHSAGGVTSDPAIAETIKMCNKAGKVRRADLTSHATLRETTAAANGQWLMA